MTRQVLAVPKILPTSKHSDCLASDHLQSLGGLNKPIFEHGVRILAKKPLSIAIKAILVSTQPKPKKTKITEPIKKHSYSKKWQILTLLLTSLLFVNLPSHANIHPTSLSNQVAVTDHHLNTPTNHTPTNTTTDTITPITTEGTTTPIVWQENEPSMATAWDYQSTHALTSLTQPNQDTEYFDNQLNTQNSNNPNPIATNPDLFVLLQAEFAADRGDLPTALDLYKSQAFKDNATSVFERALSLSMQIEPAQNSLAFAKAWQDSHNDHVPVWFYVTHLALKAEDYALAVDNIRLILSYDPKADLSQIFAGILPTHPDAQKTLLHELKDVNSDNNASVSVLKAGLLFQLGEYDAAVLYLNNAIKDSPNNLAYLTLKADIYQQANDEAKLLDFLQKSVTTTTGDTQKQLYLYHARYLIDHGRLDDAWTVLSYANQAIKNDVELSLLASLVALDMSRYDDANRLLITLSDNPIIASEANYYLGISHERMDDYDKALAYFAKVDDLQFVLPATQKRIVYQLQRGNVDEAILAAIELREKHESYTSDSYLMQADILVKQGNKADAAQLLFEAYKSQQDDLSLLYASTELLDDEADYQQKLDNLYTLLEFESTNPIYQIELARLTLQKNPNDKASLDTAKRISQVGFNDPSYDKNAQATALLVLANHALAQKDYKGVIALLQAPYDIAPDLKIGTVLLRAYQGLGDMQTVNALLRDLTEHFGGNSSPN